MKLKSGSLPFPYVISEGN